MIRPKLKAQSLLTVPQDKVASSYIVSSTSPEQEAGKHAYTVMGWRRVNVASATAVNSRSHITKKNPL